MSKIKVLVVDDHPVVQDGLRKALAAAEDMEVVAVAGNGREAVEVVRESAPDIVLLDLSMPGMNGIEAANLIKANHPEVRVIAFSMHDEDVYIQRAFSAGATGYIIKGSPVAEVTRAIREVHQGRRYLCASIQGGVVDAFLKGRTSQKTAQKYDLLSPREQQVFRLIVEGNSTCSIGNLLFISPKTVDKHRINVMHKLCVSNLVEMVKYAIRIGIIAPDL